MNPKEILFRASSMGDVMTGVAKKWDVENSLTCKRKLIQMHRELIWKRRSNKSNKYVEKGLAVEEAAITLYCRVKKTMFKKNDIRLNNEFFTGELDLYEGTEIMKAKHTIDIKSSWDWTTFPSICDEVDAAYDYQGQTYMDLSGAGIHTVVHCLVNTPASMIVDEKFRLARKMGIIGTETPEYVMGCCEIEKNAIVDMAQFNKDNPGFEFHIKNWDFDIPMEQRIHEMDVVKDESKIARMKDRVNESREWMSINLKWD